MDTHAHTTTQVERFALGIDEAAESLDLSRGGVYNLIRDGRLRTVKLGRRVLIPIDELRRLVTVQEVA